MDLYIQVHARRHLPSAVPWISEDRLFKKKKKKKKKACRQNDRGEKKERKKKKKKEKKEEEKSPKSNRSRVMDSFLGDDFFLFL